MYKVLVFVVIAALFGCSKSDDPVIDQPEEPKEYTVSLGFAGEILDIVESPLGGSEKSVAVGESDLYGIQVLSAPATGGDYRAYANGLFNDARNISIKLIQGYKYKFVCSYIADGQNKLKYYFFITGKGQFSTVTNSFNYSTTDYMIISGQGGLGLYLNDGEKYTRPNIDRYYGEYADFVPVENSSIEIPVDRVSFGAKFIAEGLTEGQLKIMIQKAPSIYLSSGSDFIEDIFSLEGDTKVATDWTGDSYTETVPVSMFWLKADGAEIPIANQEITFKRNTLTTVTLKVTDTSVDGGIGVVKESGDLLAGDVITIDASSSESTGL